MRCTRYTDFNFRTFSHGNLSPTVGGQSIAIKRRVGGQNHLDFGNLDELTAYQQVVAFRTSDGYPAFYAGVPDNDGTSSGTSAYGRFGISPDGSWFTVGTFLEAEHRIGGVDALTCLLHFQVEDDAIGLPVNSHTYDVESVEWRADSPIRTINSGDAWVKVFDNSTPTDVRAFHINSAGAMVAHLVKFGWDAATLSVTQDWTLAVRSSQFPWVFSDGSVAWNNLGESQSAGGINGLFLFNASGVVQATVYERTFSTYDTGTTGAGSTTTEVNLGGVFGTDGSSTDDEYNGMTLQLGSDESTRRTITDYDGTTKVATVAPALDAAPSLGASWSVLQLLAGSEEPVEFSLHQMAAGNRDALWVIGAPTEETGKVARILSSSFSETASSTDDRIADGDSGGIPNGLNVSENGTYGVAWKDTLANDKQITVMDTSLAIIAHTEDPDSALGSTDASLYSAWVNEAGVVFLLWTEGSSGAGYVSKMTADLTGVSWSTQIHEAGGTWDATEVRYCETNDVVLVIGRTTPRNSQVVTVTGLDGGGDVIYDGAHFATSPQDDVLVVNGMAYTDGYGPPSLLEPPAKTQDPA